MNMQTKAIMFFSLSLLIAMLLCMANDNDQLTYEWSSDPSFLMGSYAAFALSKMLDGFPECKDPYFYKTEEMEAYRKWMKEQKTLNTRKNSLIKTLSYFFDISTTIPANGLPAKRERRERASHNGVLIFDCKTA